MCVREIVGSSRVAVNTNIAEGTAACVLLRWSSMKNI